MQIGIKRLLLFFLVSVLFIGNVYAEDVVCKYPDFDLSLTYQGGSGKPTVDFSNWDKNEEVKKFLNIYKYEQSIKAYEEINIDPALYLAQGGTCPTKMYICEYTNISVDNPGLLSLGADVLSGFTDAAEGLLDIFGSAPSSLSDFNAELDKRGWTLTSNKHRLYLLNYDSYKNHEFYKYKGGKVGNDALDEFLEGYDNCKDFPIIGILAGTACGLKDSLVANFFSSLDGGVVSENNTLSIFYYRDFNCKKVTYEGEHKTIDTNCSAVVNGLSRYDTAIADYKNCTDKQCKAAKIKKINVEEKQLKTACTNVLSNYTYNEMQTDCIQSCLNLQSTLNDKKQGTDLYKEFESKNANCRLSARLVDWIMKFVNWMRYIVPVLLILLSILDYIKAIAADSEDEVKKVTSKFVKRLIVAVLIFLVPLLLEFLLGIFGINANNFCL